MMNQINEILVICFCYLVTTQAFDSDPFNSTVDIDLVQHFVRNGQIRGVHVRSREGGNDAYAFLGIPYGKNPTGKLRFKPPEAAEKWEGVLDCTQFRNQCIALPHPASYCSDSGRYMHEDCLNLNVLTPPAPKLLQQPDAKIPVLVYIHGGSNEFECPRAASTGLFIDKYVSEGLIVVTVGYRLGSMGFWSVGHRVAKGNAALEDMILALKWIKENIGYFGGDKNKVTLTGFSSSATCVSALTFSPRSKNLFQRAWLYSGTAAASFSVDHHVPEMYKTLARDVNCSAAEDDWTKLKVAKQIVDCMQKVPAQLLVDTFVADHDQGTTLPIIDGNSGVIPKDPSELIKKRHPVDLVVGNVKSETPFFELVEDALKSNKCDNLRKNDIFSGTEVEIARMFCDVYNETDLAAFEKPLKKTCAIAAEMAAVNGNFDAKDLTDRCFEFYSNRDNLYEPNTIWYWLNQADAIRNDMGAFYGTMLEAVSNANTPKSTSYLYSYDYTFAKLPPILNAHASDLTFVFGLHPPFAEFTGADQWMDERYAKLLANFAKYGDPTFNMTDVEQWKPFKLDSGIEHSNYYSINYNNFTNRECFNCNGTLFWLNALNPDVMQSGAKQLQANVAQFDVVQNIDNVDTRNSDGADSSAPVFTIVLLCILSVAILAIAAIGIVVFPRLSQRRNYNRLL